MNSGFKRILSLTLAFILTLSFAPTAMAQEVGAAPELPTATVTEIQNKDLTFAMNFVADQITDEQLAYYGDWFADFELTINKDVTFDANGTGDGWLSGQYDGWSKNWVNVPFNEPVTLEAGQTVKIMEFAAKLLGQPGLKYTYREVFESVGNFDCGVYFTPDFLEANPDLEVTLELRMYDPADETQSYIVGQTYKFKNDFVACNTTTNKVYDGITEAILEAREGETVALLRDVEERITSVLENVKLDLNGHTLTTAYVTCFGDIIDSSENNAGLLKVEDSKILIQEQNEQLPVKDGEGYRFVEVLKFNQKVKEGPKYVFQPLFEEDAHALLKAGKDATGVSVMVRVSWTQSQGTRTQYFVFNDSQLQAFLDSYNAETGKYSRQFALTLKGASSITDLTFTAVASSGVGVQFTPADTQDDTTGGETGNVTVKDNKVAEEVTINNNQASAVVPEGTLLQANTTNLTLTVKEVAEGEQTNITLGENEVQKSVDVHIDGIAEENTVPMTITLPEFVESGLNLDNIHIYHIEDGASVKMERVMSVEDFSKHNQYYYDPATGDVVLYMATFSEVAAIENTVNAWNGSADHSWYEGKESPYYIANADQLWSFSQIVGGMADGIEQDSFAGKTVTLLADINLGDDEEHNNDALIFYPIGYNSDDGKYEKTGVAVSTGFYTFKGTFDGNGHTISNFYQNTWEMKGDNTHYDATLQYYLDGMGLFGKIYGGTVKNLTVKNFSSDGEYTTTGVIAAYADGATFENIAIFNCNPRVYNIGNGGIVGCVGWYAKEANLKTSFKNITVDNSNKISALWGSYDVACGGIVGQYYPTSGQSSAEYPVNGGVHFDNCHISAQMDVYNDVCGNYQYYAYRYAGMLIGSVRENETVNGHVYPKMDGITASGCTVHFGTWNDYYYCEFEKNGHPSYSGPDDYKFSRIPHSEINFTDTNDNGIIDTEEERASVTGCKHEHTAAEDQQCVYLEFNNLVTGYGWGVTTKAVGDLAGVTILDRKDGSSVVKFEKADAAKDSYTIGTTVTIGELFAATEAGLDEKTQIQSANIQVAVSPVGETSTAGGTYAANADDWTQGTLTFTGTGAATITITDYYFCTPTTITVTIQEKVAVEKFETKFTGDFLYRVGNMNTVKLESLFKAKDGVQIGNVSVTVETISGASGVYTPNATWTDGTIQFSGTGIVKVIITDDDNCKATELILEVVDAKNATVATSATANNVVLLNDIGGGFTVSGRYTVYGNGFTLNYTGNGQYLNNGLKQGVVTVSENGTLDNLRIVASIYPYALLYYGTNSLGEAAQDFPVTSGDNHYMYQLSAVLAKDNATISNCYIYGGRNNIFMNTGNVTVTDTVLECGIVANVQIQSNASHTITFNNVTTIQYQVNPTIGDTSKVMLGAGILVGPDTTENPKIVLNGSFKQYNWVTSDDANAVSDTKITKAIIQSALDATAYNHTVNGKTASNLGIIYMNELEAEVENNTGLPYVLGDVAIKVSGNTISGRVCSLQNASGDQVSSDVENADRDTENSYYEPQFKYSDDLGGQYVEKTDEGDEHCYREGDTIYIMFPSGDTKELDLATMVNIQKYSDQDLNLEITCKDENGNAVAVTDNKISLTDAGKYTVTYTVTDNMLYDQNGNRLEARAFQTAEYSWNVTLSVSLKDVSVPDAYFAFDSTKQKMGYYAPLLGDVKQYLPFLAGLKIYDYNGKTEYLRFDGDADYNKVASVTITGYTSNEAYIEVKLTDGGVINTKFLARADSGGGSTYTGKIKTSNNIIYFVTDSGTSNKEATTTAAYWYVDYYKFTGNNGVVIQSPQQTFTSTGSSASTPSGSFGTTINYTVTFDANGGNCGQATAYATSAAAAVTLPTPTRSGYLFVGWFTAAEGGNPAGGAGESYTPSTDITLYAQWGKPSTVTYDANGGSVTPASEKYTGTALTLPTPTRDGYWFAGWSDGTKTYAAGESYQATGDITLVAQWNPVYTVTYDANGGSVDPTSAKYEGTALTLPLPNRENYAFDGWSDGTNTYAAHTSFVPAANVTLTAQWKAPVTVTYDATTNGGSCSTAPQTYLGEPLTLPTPDARTGYSFLGWYDAAEGGNKIASPYTPSDNITLYAQWEHISYTITVSKQSNATVTVDKTTAYYNETVSVTVSFSQNNSKTLTVKDASGNTVLSKSAAGTYTFTMPASNVTIEASSSGICLAPDTLITMADGTQKEIQYVSVGEEILTWNFYTGAYEVVPAALAQADGAGVMNVLHLYFEDGTELKILGEHGIFDADVNNFIFIDEFDVENYLGHRFVQKDGAGYKTTKLVSYEITTEDTVAYTILAAYHYNVVAEGMFTNSPAHVGGNFFNPFDICEGMKYDEAQVEADIAQYGLYTYEDFAHVLTEEQFNLLNLGHLKVSVGKGLVTFDGLIYLIKNFINK